MAPYASDEQRAFMHIHHPGIARRWDAEERRRAPSPGPRAFPNLDAGLVGISDRVLKDHLALYARACAELEQIQDAYPRTTWTAPQDLPVPTAEVQRLLGTRVRDLGLPLGDLFEGGWKDAAGAEFLSTVLGQLRGELLAKGIRWFPSFYLGEAEYWTADQAVSVNLPWYLGSDVLWKLVNEQGDRYTPGELLMVLRHETGHALNYAFELWRRDDWGEAFGNFHEPYRDEFPVDPGSTDFVRHLHRSGAAANLHYAQKHPDEDWAETFATWLDPGSRWREEYAEWPGALRKLEFVDRLGASHDTMRGNPPNLRVGRRAPWTQIEYTVGEFLGQRAPGQFSPHSALLRREPEVLASVVLHELYFEQLRRGAGGDYNFEIFTPFGDAVVAAFGSWGSYLTDLRAIGGSSDGWALTVWDPREGLIRNALVTGHANGIPPGCPVLLALDLHEHAYAGDVGVRKDLYLGAFFRNVDWAVVERRLAEASRSPAELPRPWGVLYAPPNPDGSRKSCGNCFLFEREFLIEQGWSRTSCKIHDVPVALEMVCGYHLFGVPVNPGKKPNQLNVLPIAPELSGLSTVPGGTSCESCRFFSALADPEIGTCSGISQIQGRGPVAVQARGCCARWEPFNAERAVPVEP